MSIQRDHGALGQVWFIECASIHIKKRFNYGLLQDSWGSMGQAWLLQNLLGRYNIRHVVWTQWNAYTSGIVAIFCTSDLKPIINNNKLVRFEDKKILVCFIYIILEVYEP